MKRLILPVLLLAILASLATWWLLGDRDRRRTPGDVSRESLDEEAPTLIGTGLVSPGEAGPDAEAPAEAPTAVDAPRGLDVGRILSRFGGVVDGRAILGIVLRGGEPVAEGTAYLFRASWEGGTSPWGGAGSARAASLISRDGTFGFEDLEDGTYYVGVQLTGLPLFVMGQRIGSDPRARPRLIYVLGTGSIHGRVLDEVGRPAADIPIRVGSRSGVGCGVTRVLTSGRGAYRVDGLPPGSYWIQAQLHGDDTDPAAVRQGEATLAEGQTLRVDIGREAGDPLISGTVRTAWGVPVRGAGNLIFSLEGADRHAVVPYDGAGRYEQHVPAGTYAVLVQFRELGRMRSVRVADGLDVREARVRFDPVVPGARVSGTVDGLDAARAKELRLRWRRADELQKAWVIDFRPDGTWHLDGVPVGSYEITGEPWPLVRADGRPARFEVRDQDTEIRVDLEAQVPEGR